MIQLIVLIISLTSFFLVSTCILFRKFGIVDKPDGVRKIHKGNVPLGGGIAMFFSLSLAVSYLIPETSLQQFDPLETLKTVWSVSFIVLFLGVKMYLIEKQLYLRSYLILLFVILSQIFLGIFTLISGLNVYLASMHQITSIILVFVVLNLNHKFS